MNWQWNLARSLVEVNLPMDPRDENNVLIEIKSNLPIWILFMCPKGVQFLISLIIIEKLC